MEELKITGIVITGIDYKENDKILTIFSLELGVVKAQIKGVKQAKSKLKYACQPFFVGEFFLIKKNGYYLITTVNTIENFYDLTSNYDRYLVGTIILETIKLTFKDGMINEALFLELLKILETLCYETTNEYMLLIKYMLNFFKLSGYGLNFDKCAVCGIKLNGITYLSLGAGGLVCEVCKDEYDIKLEKNVFSSLKIIDNVDLNKLSTVKLNNNVLIKCLMLLKLNFNSIFKVKLNSINNILI